MTIQFLLSRALFISFVTFIPLYAYKKRVAVWRVFFEGAKEGALTLVKVLPYLMAFLVAIGMLRASGFFEFLSVSLAPYLHAIGLPADLLPLVLIRPFSGSAANAMMVDVMHTHGGNAYLSKLAATMMGSTETTFYVIAVYFGAVGIRKTRYAIPVGLLADLSGVLAAIVVCRWLFL